MRGRWARSRATSAPCSLASTSRSSSSCCYRQGKTNMSDDDPILRPRLPIDPTKLLSSLLGRLFRMARTRLFWIVGGVFFIFYVIPSCCSTYVPPNMITVRQIVYGSGAGIKRDVFGPGTHFLLP